MICTITFNSSRLERISPSHHHILLSYYPLPIICPLGTIDHKTLHSSLTFSHFANNTFMGCAYFGHDHGRVGLSRQVGSILSRHARQRQLFLSWTRAPPKYQDLLSNRHCSYMCYYRKLALFSFWLRNLDY